jgi:hypothetical protein
MAAITYGRDVTGLVLIDPYNDSIYEGGKVTMVKDATAIVTADEAVAAISPL